MFSVSFDTLQPWEVGLKYNNNLKTLQSSRVYNNGRYFLGLGLSFEKFPITLQFVRTSPRQGPYNSAHRSVAGFVCRWRCGERCFARVEQRRYGRNRGCCRCESKDRFDFASPLRVLCCAIQVNWLFLRFSSTTSWTAPKSMTCTCKNHRD